MVVLLQQIHKDLNKNKLERQISVLMQDSEVQNKSGIYGSGNEKHLNLRAFDESIKKESI